MASKFAARGLFRCMRRTTMIDGIRSNAVAPSYDSLSLQLQFASGLTALQICQDWAHEPWSVRLRREQRC